MAHSKLLLLLLLLLLYGMAPNCLDAGMLELICMHDWTYYCTLLVSHTR
jgi:hypothetical protein